MVEGEITCHAMFYPFGSCNSGAGPMYIHICKSMSDNQYQTTIFIYVALFDLFVRDMLLICLTSLMLQVDVAQIGYLSVSRCGVLWSIIDT